MSIICDSLEHAVAITDKRQRAYSSTLRTPEACSAVQHAIMVAQISGGCTSHVMQHEPRQALHEQQGQAVLVALQGRHCNARACGRPQTLALIRSGTYQS